MTAVIVMVMGAPEVGTAELVVGADGLLSSNVSALIVVTTHLVTEPAAPSFVIEGAAIEGACTESFSVQKVSPVRDRL